MSFPSLGMSLGSGVSARRSSTRARTSAREVHEHVGTEAPVTQWMHPDTVKKLRALDRQRRAEEADRLYSHGGPGASSQPIAPLPATPATSASGSATPSTSNAPFVRARRPSMFDLIPPSSMPSPLLLKSLAPGLVITLNGTVGKVFYPPAPIQGLTGLWVGLHAYRSHRVGRRPLLDFRTVKMIQRKLSATSQSPQPQQSSQQQQPSPPSTANQHKRDNNNSSKETVLLIPEPLPASPEDLSPSNRVSLMGVGCENFHALQSASAAAAASATPNTASSSSTAAAALNTLSCEVDFVSLGKIQRELCKRLVGTGTGSSLVPLSPGTLVTLPCPGDHAVFIRVREVMETNKRPATNQTGHGRRLSNAANAIRGGAAAAASGSPSTPSASSSSIEPHSPPPPQTPLLPALSTPRQGIISPSASSPPASNGPLLTPLNLSNINLSTSGSNGSNLNTPSKPSGPSPHMKTLRRRGDEQQQETERLSKALLRLTLESPNLSSEDKLDRLTSSASSGINNNTSPVSANSTSASLSPHPKVLTQRSTNTKPSININISSPSHSSSGSSGFAAHSHAYLQSLAPSSEVELPSLARRLHLTGPYAEVDAIALTCPSHCAQTLFTLAKYLCSRFGATTRGEEKRARVLFRWITHHMAFSRSPLLDRWVEGEALQLSPLESANSIAAKQASKNALAAMRAQDEYAQSSAEFLSEVNEHLRRGEKTFMPHVSDLKQLAREMHIQNQTEQEWETGEKPSNDQQQTGNEYDNDENKQQEPLASGAGAKMSLLDKARRFRVLELGFGPSAARAHRRHNKGKRMQQLSNHDNHTHKGLNSSSSRSILSTDPSLSADVGDGFGDQSGGMFGSGYLMMDGSAGGANGGGGDDLSDGENDDDAAFEYEMDEQQGDEMQSSNPNDANSISSPSSSLYSNPALGDVNAPLSADSVLAHGRSTAYGFALLFQALCSIAGLECLVVRGLVKWGPEYRARLPHVIQNNNVTHEHQSPESSETLMLLDPRDRSAPPIGYSDWNLVKIEGRWYFIDAFSAAGCWDVNYHPDIDTNSNGNDNDIQQPSEVVNQDGTQSSSSDPSSSSSSSSSQGGRFLPHFSGCYFAPTADSFLLTHFPLHLYTHLTVAGGVENQMTSSPAVGDYSSDLHPGESSLSSMFGGAVDFDPLAPASSSSNTNSSYNARSRRNRTVIGSAMTGDMQILKQPAGSGNRGAAASTTSSSSPPPNLSLRQLEASVRDPSLMSRLELLSHPRALQMVQPPVSLGDWKRFVAVTRTYIEHAIETYESEHLIDYKAAINQANSNNNSNGNGNNNDSNNPFISPASSSSSSPGVPMSVGPAGATFQLELEIPVWMECVVEMTRILDHQDQDSNNQHQTTRVQFNHALRPSGSSDASDQSSSAPSAQSSPMAASNISTTSRPAQVFSFNSSNNNPAQMTTATANVSSSPQSPLSSIIHSSQQQQYKPFSNDVALTPITDPSEAALIFHRACPFDLSTCWSAQKAVGTRMEIRPPVAPGGGNQATTGPAGAAMAAAAAAANGGAGGSVAEGIISNAGSSTLLSRQRKTQHRTRMRIHLVFPQAGQYRVVIYSKQAEVDQFLTSSSYGDGEGNTPASPSGNLLSPRSSSLLVRSSPNSPAAAAVANNHHLATSRAPNPDLVVPVGYDALRGCEALMEYQIHCTQGVAEIARRKYRQEKLAMQRALMMNREIVSAANGGVDGMNGNGGSGSNSVLNGLGHHSVSNPGHLTPLMLATAFRPIVIGFLQPFLPTFAQPGIRSIASQIVCVRPWSGVWPLGSPSNMTEAMKLEGSSSNSSNSASNSNNPDSTGYRFRMQYVAPREIESMVAYSDGRWSAFHEGGSGLLAAPLTGRRLNGLDSNHDLSANASLLDSVTQEPSDYDAALSSHSDAGLRRQAPPMKYQQGQVRRIFTLDWAIAPNYKIQNTTLTTNTSKASSSTHANPTNSGAASSSRSENSALAASAALAAAASVAASSRVLHSSIAELFLFFCVGGRFHLLSFLLPRPHNALTQPLLDPREDAEEEALEKRRWKDDISMLNAPTANSNTDKQQSDQQASSSASNLPCLIVPDPTLESRFLLSVSGVSFLSSFFLRQACCTRHHAQLRLELDEGWSIRAKIVEGWSGGRSGKRTKSSFLSPTPNASSANNHDSSNISNPLVSPRGIVGVSQLTSSSYGSIPAPKFFSHHTPAPYLMERDLQHGEHIKVVEEEIVEPNGNDAAMHSGPGANANGGLLFNPHLSASSSAAASLSRAPSLLDWGVDRASAMAAAAAASFERTRAARYSSSAKPSAVVRRLVLTAQLPSPNSIQNASSTRHFTLLIYLRNERLVAARAGGGGGSHANAEAGEEKSNNSARSATNNSAPFRFALAWKVYAGNEA